MDAIPEFPKLVVEKKRAYEAEEREQQSPSCGRDISIGDGVVGVDMKSSSSSTCQYSTWKQKRKLNHNDTNSGGAQVKSPNSKYSPHSNDGSLPSPGMTSPISFATTTTNSDGSRDAGEKLVDDDRIIPVHDNPFFVKDGRRSLDRRDMNGSLDYHNDETINNRQDLSNFRDDTDMEYHPGSGFVSRLKDKFSSLGAREDVTVLRPKRSSSFENLLDGRPKSHNGGDLGLTDTRRKFRDGRAVSVENLNHTMDKSSTSPNLVLDLKLAKQGSSDSGSDIRNTNKDRETVVPEKSPTIHPVSPSPSFDAKPHISVISAAANDENKNVDELPKPNTVSSFRSLFENSAMKPKGKTTPAPVKPVNSTTPETLISPNKKESKATLVATKPAPPPPPKERNHEASVKKPEVAKRTVLEQKNSGIAENNSSSLEKDSSSVKTTAKQATPSLPLTSHISSSPTLETSSSSQINQVSDSKRVAPVVPAENDHHSVSESKENTRPSSDTNAEFHNRGLPSILMRKNTDDSGELGQVVLRKVKPRILEDDDELKGRITYYPAGLNKTTNSSSSEEPTPKMRHPPLVTGISGIGNTDLWGEEDDEDIFYADGEVIEKDVEDNRHIIITDSMLKKNPNAGTLTHLDLSHLTNDGGQEHQEGYIPSKIGPCKIQFIGANVKLDRSCIIKNKTSKHKVCFSDQISTLHDYPSEEVMLEHYLLEHPEERNELLLLEGHGLDGMNESTDDGSESDDSSPVSPDDGMRSNLALSSTGGLARYHSKYGMEYEFGMQMEEELKPAVHDKKLNNGQETDIYQLTPADERDLTSWSNVSGTDLLF
ncbi:nuclear receptor coactivator 6-like [Octopus vulgaris]|uniref:Nuclear receptor coactivator 6-like n=1 Tax=Octopus vulgaris TaxID=6645 RepID=A0AA36BQL5_OCTVU|nr:nuclear receptor coactivator 6-like [Octopus vulgaris]